MDLIRIVGHYPRIVGRYRKAVGRYRRKVSKLESTRSELFRTSKIFRIDPIATENDKNEKRIFLPDIIGFSVHLRSGNDICPLEMFN